MAMKKIIDEISVIPGVTGSCIFDKQEGPLCSDSEETVAVDVLRKVGAYLIRMMKMGSKSGLDITTTHFRLDNCSVVGIPLDSGSILLTVCDTKANCSLVATTAEMLAADMREELEREVTVERVSGEEGILEVLDLIDNNRVDYELQGYFERVEEALAMTIGPVASIVIKDHIDKWKQQGPAVTTRLDDLTEMLAEEIGEAALARDFRTQVARLL